MWLTRNKLNETWTVINFSCRNYHLSTQYPEQQDFVQGGSLLSEKNLHCSALLAVGNHPCYHSSEISWESLIIRPTQLACALFLLAWYVDTMLQLYQDWWWEKLARTGVARRAEGAWEDILRPLYQLRNDSSSLSLHEKSKILIWLSHYLGSCYMHSKAILNLL